MRVRACVGQFPHRRRIKNHNRQLDIAPLKAELQLVSVCGILGKREFPLWVRVILRND